MLNPHHIQFRKTENAQSGFELISLQSIFNRKDLDHSPYDFHLVEFYMLILIEEGQGEHTIDFTAYNYKKGTLLTIRKDQIHRFHFNNSVKGSLLLFTDDFLVRFLEKLEAQRSLQLFNELLGAPKLQLDREAYMDIMSLVERIKIEFFKTKDPYSIGIIRSELHILLTKLFRIKSALNPVVVQKKYLNQFVVLQELIESHVLEHKQVAYYAKIMGKSTKTLNAITQSILHKTAKEFIDAIATKQIKRLLLNTNLSIKEIAFASGFEETTNFYKYFKRQTEQTPEQFRVENK